MIEGTYIRTFSGKQFDFTDPDPKDITIEDIAHHLSQITRYSGATAQPYSVAQHSCLVANHLHGTLGPEAALVGLLHDASEAYLNDVTRPLKMLPIMAGYRQLEDVVQRMIFRLFGVTDEPGQWLKDADELVYHAEMRDLMHGHYLHHQLARDFPPISPWLPTTAEAQFLTLFGQFSTVDADVFS